MRNGRINRNLESWHSIVVFIIWQATIFRNYLSRYPSGTCNYMHSQTNFLHMLESILESSQFKDSREKIEKAKRDHGMNGKKQGSDCDMELAIRIPMLGFRLMIPFYIKPSCHLLRYIRDQYDQWMLSGLMDLSLLGSLKILLTLVTTRTR